ncbi:MAG: hemin uptake protein HemP [Sulfuritalea sp.]|nr:hemin uptake protein HemP [Sulfuritalea sp.]
MAPQRPLDSVALLGNRGEVEIAHQGETYRLRRTRQGKLILTK